MRVSNLRISAALAILLLRAVIDDLSMVDVREIQEDTKNRPTERKIRKRPEKDYCLVNI